MRQMKWSKCDCECETGVMCKVFLVLQSNLDCKHETGVMG